MCLPKHCGWKNTEFSGLASNRSLYPVTQAQIKETRLIPHPVYLAGLLQYDCYHRWCGYITGPSYTSSLTSLASHSLWEFKALNVGSQSPKVHSPDRGCCSEPPGHPVREVTWQWSCLMGCCSWARVLVILPESGLKVSRHFGCWALFDSSAWLPCVVRSSWVFP